MNGPNVEERLGRVEIHVRNIDLRLERVEQILPTLATRDDLRGMPTVDDPKGFVTTADLEAFGERESVAMRAFLLEVVQKSTADLRDEMRVLFEEQRTWFQTLNDKIDGVRDLAVAVDADSRARDAALDRRLTRLERR